MLSVAAIALALPGPLASAAEPIESSGGATSSQPPEQTTEESGRWVPGLSIYGLGMIQGRNATIESVERGFHAGSSRGVYAILGLSAEVGTPAFTRVPGEPRLFVHADAALSFDNSEPVVNEGDPKPIEVQSVGGTGVVAPVAGTQGRGSATRIETQSPIVSAGVGLAFDIPVWDRTLRIKPSVEWQWQEDQLLQLFGEAETNGSNPLLCDPSCRTLFIEASRTESFHSLGAGLELEVESARIGDTILTVFASGRAYRLLGDRGFDLVTTGSWDVNVANPPRAPTTVTSTFERDPWHYAVGVGIRFLWRPE